MLECIKVVDVYGALWLYTYIYVVDFEFSLPGND